MRKFIMLASLVLVCCLSGGWEKKDQSKRPEGFPEIIAVPNNVSYVRYWAKPREDIYGVGFVLGANSVGEYRAELVHEPLSRSGWDKLEYDLMNPCVPASYGNPFIYYLNRNGDANDQDISGGDYSHLQ